MSSKACPSCKNKNNTDAPFCVICDFPFNGSEKEKGIHIGKFISNKGIIDDSEDYLIKSQRLLYIAALFYLIGTVVYVFSASYYVITLVVNLFVITILVVSAIFIKKQPLLFLGLPTFVLTTIYVSEYFIDPLLLLKGIIFKLIIFGCLIYSIYIYFESKAFKKKFNIN